MGDVLEVDAEAYGHTPENLDAIGREPIFGGIC